MYSVSSLLLLLSQAYDFCKCPLLCITWSLLDMQVVGNHWELTIKPCVPEMTGTLASNWLKLLSDINRLVTLAAVWHLLLSCSLTQAWWWLTLRHLTWSAAWLRSCFDSAGSIEWTVWNQLWMQFRKISFFSVHFLFSFSNIEHLHMTGTALSTGGHQVNKKAQYLSDSCKGFQGEMFWTVSCEGCFQNAVVCVPKEVLRPKTQVILFNHFCC